MADINHSARLCSDSSCAGLFRCNGGEAFGISNVASRFFLYLQSNYNCTVQCKYGIETVDNWCTYVLRLFTAHSDVSYCSAFGPLRKTADFHLPRRISGYKASTDSSLHYITLLFRNYVAYTTCKVSGASPCRFNAYHRVSSSKGW